MEKNKKKEISMDSLKFLEKIDRNALKSEKKIYRGGILWYLLCSDEKKIIYVSTSNRNLENYYSMLDTYNIRSKISLFENIFSSREDLTGINIELVDTLKNKSEFIVFINLQVTLDIFFEKVEFLYFKVGKEYKFSQIVEFLTENGYQQVYLVEKKGEFSKRGDIVDIYPPNMENPIRLEFFDEELESIREFDVDSQRSIVKLEEVKLFGNLLSGNNYEFVELINELKSEDVTIVMENEELLNYKMEEYILLNREKEEIYRKRYENLKKKSLIIETLNFTEEQLETFKDKTRLEKLSSVKNIQLYTKNYSKKVKEYENVYSENKIDIINRELFEGFIAGDTFVLTDREMDGYIYEKKKRRNKGIKYKKPNQIMMDDYVIHVQYGVGIYKGIKTMDERDYLKIKYADEDILYIPVEKLDRLEKFMSGGEEPKIYKLGTRGFKKKREKIAEDMEKFAAELLKIQAQRESRTGFQYGKDTVWQEEFEALFPFEITEDQKKAIKDVKEDMESPKIMDRIICGDVGYGKTEVAMRAAFKAVENGRQVILIAPTTVLAEQHYKRFSERFSGYPVTVANLSRLTQGKSKEILKSIKKGTADLVIGTHRLLSEDVEFKNLGLLIIDEEQKFGVKAKEKLKKKKENVDVLTLTATPIPRTLNLALLGIREISIIDTPPVNRIPIITEVISGTDEEIRNAILRELSRDGQVFYIYNEVKKINYKLDELKKILPDFVKLEYIHGQLPPKEIKDKLKRFEEGKFDVLVASTIIENGIDVSNANTILIEKFTNMGLSQVYQLRGRVGRSNRQGYCYLLKRGNITAKGKKKEETMHKVEGIKSGGFQISMEDMKIRGAGELLGDKQHGTIETFGYDLYIKMLNEEIKRQKGESDERIENVEIVLKEKGFIPEDYIEREERLNIYKRFALVDSLAELTELKEEIKDRFGKIHEKMENFIENIRFKIFAEKYKIQKVIEREKVYELHYSKEFEKASKYLEKSLKMKEVVKKAFVDEYKEGTRSREVKSEEVFIIKEVGKEELKKFLINEECKR